MQTLNLKGIIDKTIYKRSDWQWREKLTIDGHQ